MQQSWLGIALAILVIVGGLMLGLARSKNAAQKRALTLAFCMLALVIVGFFVTVVTFAQTWATPWFALASIVAPLAVYLVATASLRTAPVATTPTPRRRKAASAAVGPSAAARPTPLHTTPSHAAPLSSRTVPSFAPLPLPLDENEMEPIAPASAIPAAGIAPEAPLLVEEPSFAEEPSFVKESPLVEEPAIVRIAPSPAVAKQAAVPEPTAIPELAIAVEPIKAAEEIPALAAGPKPADVPATRAAVPEPAAVPASAIIPEPAAPRPAAEPASDAVLAKAHLLRERGAFGVAARLFAEAVASCADEDARIAIRFEQLACSVKADRMDEARELVTLLSGCDASLSAVQRVKLQAATRMV